MRLGKRTILIVDVLGGLVFCALATFGVWHALLRPSAAFAELGELRDTLEDRSGDVVKLEREFVRQGKLLRERQAELDGGGAPPRRIPLEDNLRAISVLARRAGMDLAEITPLGKTWYPGIGEVRYRVTGGGRYETLSAVLRDFENCDFWGDITYLRIGRTNRGGASVTEREDLELTVSFYSAHDEVPATTEGL